MKKEIWKDIDGFDNYQCSSLGRIKRKDSYFVRTDGRTRRFKEKMMAFQYNKGYAFVHMQLTGISKRYPVHRIVASVFIENQFNKSDVNHKNGIRNDNRVENLEWATRSENIYHAMGVLGKDYGIKNRKKVKCLTNGKEYESARMAAKELGITRSNIYTVLGGHSKTAKGMKFIYI